MAKIFGISDLPVSTIDETIRLGGDVVVPKPYYSKLDMYVAGIYRRRTNTVAGSRSGHSFLSRMKKGFSKLMSHPLKNLRK